MKRLLHWLHRFEDFLLVTVLAAMVLLAVLQIVLRNFFSLGLPWIDPLLQNGVLWIGLLGAMIASRTDGHIRIDLVPRFTAGASRRLVLLATDLFACGICVLVAWHSFFYVREEAEFPIMAFANVPAWWLQVIIPLGFAIIGLRFLVLLVLGILDQRPIYQHGERHP